MVIEEKFVNGKNIHPLRFIYWSENISKIRRLECISKIFGGVKYDITSFLTAILTFLNPNVDFLNSYLTFIDFLSPNRPNYWVRLISTFPPFGLNSKKNIFSRAVGWEGFFGAIMLSILLVPFYYIILPPAFCADAVEPALNGSCRLEGRSTLIKSFPKTSLVQSLPTIPNPKSILLPLPIYSDAIDGLYQMGNNPLIVVAVIGNIVSIAFFNFFGLSVTKTQSATTRMVLDSIRTIVIWAVCLALGWEEVI